MAITPATSKSATSKIKHIIEVALIRAQQVTDSFSLIAPFACTIDEQVYPVDGQPYTVSVQVEVTPPSRWSNVGLARVVHPELGIWAARLNGTHCRTIGKPSCNHTPAQLTKAAS